MLTKQSANRQTARYAQEQTEETRRGGGAASTDLQTDNVQHADTRTSSSYNNNNNTATWLLIQPLVTHLVRRKIQNHRHLEARKKKSGTVTGISASDTCWVGMSCQRDTIESGVLHVSSVQSDGGEGGQCEKSTQIFTPLASARPVRHFYEFTSFWLVGRSVGGRLTPASTTTTDIEQSD